MKSTALATTTPEANAIAPNLGAGELVIPGEGLYGLRPCDEIRASYTNRKRFDSDAMERLAENIKLMGVAQPIVIRPVSPTTEAPQRYEIVAGERRWRASIMAGQQTIPSMLRVLTDQQALEIQITENLQREDPHPLEEADGFQQLMLNYGFTAEQVMSKFSRSRAYVYGRIKLCSLAEKLREPFFDNKISAEIALLIARLPTAEMQVKAYGEITDPHGHGVYIGDGSPLSVRQTRDLLRRRYSLNLLNAVFPIADAKLLPSAGSCVQCPKRTGNQPEVYDDEHSADVCTDPDCFAEKSAAHTNRAKASAVSNGLEIIDGESARKIVPNAGDTLKGGYVDLDATIRHDGKTTSYRTLLGGITPTPSVLVHPFRPGVTLEVVQLAAVDELLQEAGIARPETDADRAAQGRVKEKEQEAKAKLERRYRRTLFAALHDAGLAASAPYDERAVALLLFRQAPSNEVGNILTVNGLDPALYAGIHANGKWTSGTELVGAAIRDMSLLQVRQMIRDLSYASDLSVYTHTTIKSLAAGPMIDAATELGIDATAIRTTLVKEAKAEADAKSKSKAKAKLKSLAKPIRPAQAVLPAIEPANAGTHFTEAAPARVKLKLKPKSESDQAPAPAGPIIRVKPNRAAHVVTPETSWPFPKKVTP